MTIWEVFEVEVEDEEKTAEVLKETLNDIQRKMPEAVIFSLGRLSKTKWLITAKTEGA